MKTKIYLALSYLMAIATYFTIEIRWRYFIIITFFCYFAAIIFYRRSVDKNNESLLYFMLQIIQIAILFVLLFVVWTYTIVAILFNVEWNI